jgi:hypothetical protein
VEIAGAILLYVFVGLVITRITASYFSERFRLEGVHGKKIKKGERKLTLDDFLEKYPSYGNLSEFRQKQEYQKHLKEYPSLSIKTLYETEYHWYNDNAIFALVFLLPFVWLPLIIGYLPVKYTVKYSTKAIRSIDKGMDYVGKELANPRENIRRNK